MTAARLRLLVLLAMESLWTYVAVLFVATIFGDGGDLPPWPAVAVLLWGGFATTWYCGRRKIEPDTASAIGIAVALLSFAIVFRLTFAGDIMFWRPGALLDFIQRPHAVYAVQGAAIASGIGMIAVWARGAWLARESALESPPDVRSFATGLAVVPLALALGEGDVSHAAAIVALPFAALGLAALALGHLDRTMGGSDVRLPGWWTKAMLGVMGGALIAALVLPLLPWSLLLDLPTVRPLLSAVGAGLQQLLYWLLTPIFVAMEWLLRTVLGLMGVDTSQPGRADYSKFLRPNEHENGKSPFPDWVAPAVRYTFFFLLAAVAGLLAWRMFGQRPLPTGDDAPDRIALGAAEAEAGGRGWFDRFRRHGDRPGAGPIGRLYGDLLLVAERRGLVRPPSRTPNEFAPELRDRLEAPVALEISEAFARARYGGLPPDDLEVERMRRDLKDTRG